MSRRIILNCTGCGETFEASPGLVGALCGKGQVRRATEAEAWEYCAGDPVCNCESDSYTIPCEVH
jgi:hypothetical protein